MTKFNSLRSKLFIWYIGSLVLLGALIILTVHIYQYTYSAYILAGALIFLSIVGFVAIYKITQSITNLTIQIRQISSKNLGTRITPIASNDEIGELGSSFNDLLDRLDIAFRRERQFIADMAHEMKTPMSTLRSSFEVTLQKNRTNEEYKKIIEDSIHETDKITNTLKDVLELAWSEVPSENQRRTFNLSDLILDLAEIAQTLAIKKNITVNQTVASEILINGFRERLGRAAMNVIENAIKYTPENGSIEIFLNKKEQNAIITIKDTGPGIDETEKDHIFERFYRGSKVDKVFGAGLGLAITKSTIIAHKGKIEVKAKAGEGSIFEIALPLK